MLNAGSGSGNVCSAGPCPAADLPVGGAVARRNGVIPQAHRLDAQRHALERDVSELEDITQGMAEIENVYRALPYDLTQFGEPRGMEFGLYTPSTRSANELIDALNAFVRLTTASVALAAYTYPQLGIPIGRGTPCSLSSLLARVERAFRLGLGGCAACGRTDSSRAETEGKARQAGHAQPRGGRSNNRCPMHDLQLLRERLRRGTTSRHRSRTRV